jgi:flavin reductase (DIM6/NTAB) family NADH-FMN oxidoreductase RutF
MNRTAAEFPPDVDEFKEAGLTAVPGDLVKAPRVAESPVSMECKLFQVLELPPSPQAGHLIIGEVVLVHASDELWSGKDIDITRLKSIGRLGGQLYCRVNDIFEMKRP